MINLLKYGKVHPMTFKIANYAENGNLYVGLITHEDGYPAPWSDLTVNLSVKCKDNCAFLDTNHNGNEIIMWLEERGFGHCTGNLMPSGWCVYPEFEFNMEKLMEHVTEDYRNGDD